MNTNLTSSEENDELKNAPLLRSLRSADPFQAPEGYFDRLSSDIQDKIHHQKTAVFSTFFEWKSALAILGILVLAILAGTQDYSPKFQPLAQHTSAEPSISCEDIINSNYYLEFDETLLSEAMELSDTALVSPAFSGDETLENYLIQQTEESFLINEL